MTSFVFIKLFFLNPYQSFFMNVTLKNLPIYVTFKESIVNKKNFLKILRARLLCIKKEVIFM